MSSTNLVKLGPRTPENRWAEMPHPQKLHGINVLNRQKSAMDYSISLKFCTDFGDHMMLDVP